MGYLTLFPYDDNEGSLLTTSFIIASQKIVSIEEIFDSEDEEEEVGGSPSNVEELKISNDSNQGKHEEQTSKSRAIEVAQQNSDIKT